jgi:hypothetical protein
MNEDGLTKADIRASLRVARRVREDLAAKKRRERMNAKRERELQAKMVSRAIARERV